MERDIDLLSNESGIQYSIFDGVMCFFWVWMEDNYDL